MAYYDEGENSLITGIGTHALIPNEGMMPYWQKRREEYPDIGEQLDDLYKQGLFSPEMTARIKATKDRYDKETEEQFAAKVEAFNAETEKAIEAERVRLAREEEERIAAKIRMEEEALAEWRAAHPGE